MNKSADPQNSNQIQLSKNIITRDNRDERIKINYMKQKFHMLHHKLLEARTDQNKIQNQLPIIPDFLGQQAYITLNKGSMILFLVIVGCRASNTLRRIKNCCGSTIRETICLKFHKCETSSSRLTRPF
ncbi:hypothetical protein Droror1_Dr00026467 [Drosera rotundifolia]